jgi:hypothetical protein
LVEGQGALVASPILTRSVPVSNVVTEELLCFSENERC